jgi:hypothetical protein
MVKAQPTTVEEIFDKYAGEKNFTAVNLDDFEIFSSFLEDKTKDDPEAREAFKQIQAMKVLVYQKNGTPGGKGDEFIRDLKNLEQPEGYKVFLSINQDDNFVKMMTKHSQAAPSEFLILVIEKEEVVLLWLKGDIDIKNLKKLGDIMKD